MAFEDKPTDFDVVIIGAGLSGLCFAYRLQQSNPDLSYCILESRSGIGGTWSFFRYPGLRSDSDLYTFGFPWRPWTEPECIAKGGAIVNYMNNTAAADGIDQHIRYNCKVDSLKWSSKTRTWTVKTCNPGRDPSSLKSRFVMLATGYYDYEQPLQAAIPGIENFQGPVVHPQFWPDDLDYTNKRVVIIGSGATAITLLPSMVPTAANVTMLQRSPAYLMSLPNKSRFEKILRFLLPISLANQLIRLRWILFSIFFRKYCLLFPTAARRMMRNATALQVKDPAELETNFTPTYNPFEQRMCMCPDGDFFECLRNGSGAVKTGHIETVTSDSIVLKGGEKIETDIVVTATGLKLRLGGGIRILIDGNTMELKDRHVWKGVMFSDIPNLFFSFGYLDASWTLGVDTSAQLAGRIAKQMRRERASVVVPSLPEVGRGKEVKEIPFMPLRSTYVQKALSVLPRFKDLRQWRPRATYFWEWFGVRYGDIWTDLEYVREY